MTTDILFSNDIEAIKKSLADPYLDVNVTNKKGLTPLMFHKDIEIVKLLLAHPNIDIHKTFKDSTINAFDFSGSDKALLLLNYPDLHVLGTTEGIVIPYGEGSETFYHNWLDHLSSFGFEPDEITPLDNKLYEILEKLFSNPKFDINHMSDDYFHFAVIFQNHERIFDMIINHPKFKMTNKMYIEMIENEINLTAFKKVAKILKPDYNNFITKEYFNGRENITYDILFYAICFNCSNEFVKHILEQSEYKFKYELFILASQNENDEIEKIIYTIMDDPRFIFDTSIEFYNEIKDSENFEIIKSHYKYIEPVKLENVSA